MLATRYPDMGYIKSLPWKTGVGLINKAIEEKNRSNAWDMYISQLPWMTKDTYKSFEDYYTLLTQKPSEANAEDIVKMAQEIHIKAGGKLGNI